MILFLHFSASSEKTISLTLLNPIQDGGGGKKGPPPPSFSPVTSANIETNPQNFLTFSFSTFATLV